MKKQTILVLLCTCILLGCSATARFYPVQGPLSTQTPVPVYVARMTDGLRSGVFSAILNDGEVCKGRWELVRRPGKSEQSTASSSAAASSMSAEWDLVYGQGFYVAHVLGARHYGRAVLTGDRGTVLNLELYKPDQEREQLGAIKGVAKDDKGNVYKIAF